MQNVDADLEIERLNNEIESLKDELKRKKENWQQMIHDFAVYKESLKIREIKLRNYIKSTNQNLLKSDKEEQKSTREILKKEVLTGVEKIPQSIRTSIRVKKKELDNKIKIKLMDMDYKHQVAYGEVLKNHNNILNSAKLVEEEYQHICDNNERANIKFLKLKEENEENINRRNEIKKRILKTKRDYMNMKRIVNMINDAIDDKLQKEKEEKEKLASIRKENHGLETVKSKIIPKTVTNFRKSVSPSKTLLKRISNFGMEKNEEEELKELGKGFVMLEVKNILNISEKIIQKSPKCKNSLISYSNILNNNYNRLLKLRDVMTIMEDNKNEVQKRVYFILYKLKEISLQHNYLKLKFLDIGGIYMSKDDRTKLINFLITDDIINEIFKTSKFPSINTIERKIYTAK